MRGHAVERERCEQSAAELEEARALIRRTARSPELGTAEGSGLVKIIGRYTQTFLSKAKGHPDPPDHEHACQGVSAA